VLTVRDLPSGDRLIPDGSPDMRSCPVHMYLPPRLLPTPPLVPPVVARRRERADRHVMGAMWMSGALTG